MTDKRTRKRTPRKPNSRKKYPCEKCGVAPKLPGQGKRYCADCDAAAAWRRERKRQTRMVVKRSPCERCHGVKEPGHGRRYCLKCKEKRRKKRMCIGQCGTEVPFPTRLCDQCRKISAERVKLYNRKRNKRWRERNPNYKPNKRPPTTQAQREDRRILYRLNGGGSQRRLKVGIRDGIDRIHIPAEPLRPFLSQSLEVLTANDLGDLAHVRPYTITEIAEGKVDRISIGSADRLCVALGLNLSNLYPDWHTWTREGAA